LPAREKKKKNPLRAMPSQYCRALVQGRRCSFAGAEDPTAMARSGIAAMRVPPLVPLPSSSNSNGGGFSASFTTSASRFSSNVKNRECCFVACTFVVARSRGGISKFSGFGKYLRHLQRQQQQQLSRATVSDESSSDSTSAVSVFFFFPVSISMIHPQNQPLEEVLSV